MNKLILCGAAVGGLLMGSQVTACSSPNPGARVGSGGSTGSNQGGGICLTPPCEGTGGGGGGLGEIPMGNGGVGSIDDPPAPGCGNGMVNPTTEACDDGNNNNGDGCWGNCLRVEPGYLCRDEGMPCAAIARCGDGAIIFPEQCDDGNADPGDGCSSTCKVELGWKCDSTAGCSRTTCGDDVVEGSEMCEPALNEGCTSQCQFAPDCSGSGACTSECGDGLVLGEDCDDGNRQNGDGCDENCHVEDGYDCAVEEGECEVGPTGECILRVPATFRDFDATHSDFEANTCQGGQDIVPGIVESELVNGKPVSVSGAECTTNMADWYVDVPGVNTTVHGELVLYETASGQFVNRYGENGEKWAAPFGNAGDCACEDAAGCEYDGNPLFFPVDSLGTAGGVQAGLTPDYGVCWMDENAVEWHENTGPHNFHFTSEVTYWFPFDEDTNATLDFNGDDDLWVFVNGQLAVDVGGIHPPRNGSVTILGSSPEYGMTPGNVYEIKVFHAERRTKGSTFKLTLSGFNARRSDCRAICGDGIIGFGEECDDGADNKDDAYNACGTDCRLGAFCGDGIKQDGEACDDNDPNAPPGCSGCNLIIVR